MKVLLLQDVFKLGKAGDIIEVKDGYARNYLVPKGLAIPVTKGTLKEIEARKRAIERRREKQKLEALKLKEKLESTLLKLKVKVGKDKKLFGSVTSANIVEALEKEGIAIDKKSVLLDNPIKSLGLHKVKVKLFEDVVAELTLEVLPEGEPVQA